MLAYKAAMIETSAASLWLLHTIVAELDNTAHAYDSASSAEPKFRNNTPVTYKSRQMTLHIACLANVMIGLCRLQIWFVAARLAMPSVLFMVHGHSTI